MDEVPESSRKSMKPLPETKYTAFVEQLQHAQQQLTQYRMILQQGKLEKNQVSVDLANTIKQTVLLLQQYISLSGIELPFTLPSIQSRTDEYIKDVSNHPVLTTFQKNFFRVMYTVFTQIKLDLMQKSSLDNTNLFIIYLDNIINYIDSTKEFCYVHENAKSDDSDAKKKNNFQSELSVPLPVRIGLFFASSNLLQQLSQWYTSSDAKSQTPDIELKPSSP